MTKGASTEAKGAAPSKGKGVASTKGKGYEYKGKGAEYKGKGYDYKGKGAGECCAANRLALFWSEAGFEKTNHVSHSALNF